MNINKIFADALAEIIATVSGFTLDVHDDGHNADFDEMVGVMALNSKKRGMIFISAGEPSMRVLCSFMTGVPADQVTADDMHDALCELVNMTAGNVKLRINDEDYMFELVPPFIISGESMSLGTKKRVIVSSSNLVNASGDISVKLKIVY